MLADYSRRRAYSISVTFRDIYCATVVVWTCAGEQGGIPRLRAVVDVVDVNKHEFASMTGMSASWRGSITPAKLKVGISILLSELLNVNILRIAPCFLESRYTH